MTRTAVVILNYNGEKLLRQFLPAVIAHSGDAAIVVADNGSTDRSAEIIRNEFPNVRLIELGANYGFTGGYNRALREVKALYYVLLNSDVEVTPGWLAPMEKLLQDDHTVAAIQPKILSWRHRNLFEYAGAAGGYIDSFGYPFCRGRIFDHVDEDRGQYNDTTEIFWASGACMMIRSSVFHTFNGFDEELFAHMEEIDLCWKIQRTSYRVMYCGTSCVYHLGAGTLGYDNPKKVYLNFRNGLIVLYKHLGTGELLWKLPLRMGLDWLASLSFLLKAKPANAGSVLKAHGSFLAGIRRQHRKRRTLRRAFPWYSRKNIHRSLIVLDFFLHRRKIIHVNNPR